MTDTFSPRRKQYQQLSTFQVWTSPSQVYIIYYLAIYLTEVEAFFHSLTNKFCLPFCTQWSNIEIRLKEYKKKTKANRKNISNTKKMPEKMPQADFFSIESLHISGKRRKIWFALYLKISCWSISLSIHQFHYLNRTLTANQFMIRFIARSFLKVFAFIRIGKLSKWTGSVKKKSCFSKMKVLYMVSI